MTTHRAGPRARLAGFVAVCACAAAFAAEPAKPTLPKIDEAVLADPKAASAAADVLEASFAGKAPPESVRMLTAILRGSRLAPGEGWFGPAQTRFTWKALAESHGVDPKGGTIPRKAFKGTDLHFSRLDRDGDGAITADDLDWSESSEYLRRSAMVRGWVRGIAGGGAALTKKQWTDFFDAAAKGKETLTPEDLQTALANLGRRPAPKGGAKMNAAFRSTLVRGLFAGEIGSVHEGPSVGRPAPAFTLKTIDGKTVSLADKVGKKPLVLVFGNYTCAPFCRSYPSVEPVAKRFAGEAEFLMVYVREAHPSDGWSMGEDIKQPKTYEERRAVAEKFVKLTSPTIPVLIDELNDPAGHAYSGMPSRLYVIDTKGNVAFKNGRGPHGFRIDEMEQALVMCLLESAAAPRASK